jgi:hypothetical protein
MAKRQRESRLLDKRAAKEARKIARKEAAADGSDSVEPIDETYFGPLAEDRRPD